MREADDGLVGILSRLGRLNWGWCHSLGDVEGVGAIVVNVVFVDTVEEGDEVDAEDSNGAHVFKSGICSFSQPTKCETSA